ncbi:Zn(II)2Cys6 transcription factor [Aspergillus ibericus CBS 121593]|uniref:Zn(2)-C6 fungal-type domain-containing protein n=1 Tax=Aspergillus ibericus CBS 121593 TaxID=1448316 RepID=A0A395HE38_9EURO|nr:hypothetical protein BO80DRAFT_490234 [Aspergillus ibericus CBS 121593]RAL05936.1 hypothetical protein BO80DRAFT_490234 [Aspergillus ibericus CBS 121593]
MGTDTRVKRRRGGTRKKTGCYISSFACKARHTRCDEKKPICSNCERFELECWPSNFIAYSAWCSTDRGGSDQQEAFPTENSMRTGDQALASTSTSDIVRASCPDLQHSHSSNPDPVLSESSHYNPDRMAVTTVHQMKPQPTMPLTSEMFHLLNEYWRGLATWMDVFDLSDTYHREVARQALTSELLRCICAFTARQLCLRASGEVWAPAATNYNSPSLHLLIQQLNSCEPLRDTLTAVILLGSYEVLAAQGQEHHRHYEGARKLIKLQGISARSSDQAVLQLDPSDWNVNWWEGETAEDLLSNQLLWLIGRAVNWIYKDKTPRKYQELLTDTEGWYTGLSQHFRGVRYGEMVEDGLSKVHFAVPQTAAAMLWYHLLHLMLYAEPVLQDVAYIPKIQEHATEIINISISDIPDQVRCFSILPLYFAGKHVDSIVRKTRVLVLLSNIQIELGYHTGGLVQKLQQFFMPATD